MAALSSSALVLAWEHGAQSPPLDRVLALLAAANPGRDAETLREVTVAQRDEELLSLREEVFGRRVDAVVDCPRCGEALELTFDTAELERGWHNGNGSDALEVEDTEILFRLPTCMDLSAAAAEADVARAHEVLLERCVISPPASTLSASVRRAVAERMGRLDPLAALEFEFTCPACEHTCAVGFDAASFVWAEFESLAKRALEDVHALASAYGWSESAVLELSPERRRLYREFVG